MVRSTMSIETDFPAAAKLTYLNAASVALMPRSASDYAEAWQLMFVIPAKAGTQEKQGALQPLGPRFRGCEKIVLAVGL